MKRNWHIYMDEPFPHLNLKDQCRNFKEAGFQIIQAEEAYCPVIFYDIGAFVWFAHIIYSSISDYCKKIIPLKKANEEKKILESRLILKLPRGI